MRLPNYTFKSEKLDHEIQDCTLEIRESFSFVIFVCHRTFFSASLTHAADSAVVVAAAVADRWTGVTPCWDREGHR